MDRFINELDAATLTRNLAKLRRSVAIAWNALVGLHAGAGLELVAVPPSAFVPTRIRWDALPESFREDVERYLTWASVRRLWNVALGRGEAVSGMPPDG